GPVGDVLERAAADSIFQPTPVEIDDLEFRHLLIRDAAYAALPLARRAELHERHADWWDRTHRVPPLEAEALAVYHLDQAYRARATLAPDDERLQADGAAIAARSAALGRILLARGDAAAAAALLGRARSLRPTTRSRWSSAARTSTSATSAPQPRRSPMRADRVQRSACSTYG